jgi:hypothetical protein
MLRGSGDVGDKPVVVGPPRLLERPAGGSRSVSLKVMFVSGSDGVAPLYEF